MPHERTLSRWLKETTSFYRDRLQALLREIAFATFLGRPLHRATLDLDGTVIRTGERVDGAERGFNPHHPKDPSYYPLTAHLAQTGQFLGVWSRPGNVNDSVDAVKHLGELMTTRSASGSASVSSKCSAGGRPSVRSARRSTEEPNAWAGCLPSLRLPTTW